MYAMICPLEKEKRKQAARNLLTSTFKNIFTTLHLNFTILETETWELTPEWLLLYKDNLLSTRMCVIEKKNEHSGFIILFPHISKI